MRRLMILGALVLFSCVESGQDAPPTTQSYPTSEATNATTVFLTGAVVTTRIVSNRIISYSDRDSAWAYTLQVDFFDEEGVHTSTLTADSALVRERERFFEVYGKVRIVTDDGRTLDTDRLAWDDEKRLIRTESYVEIRRDEDLMAGWGFESDHELTRIKLRRQVSGTLKDTRALEDTL
ncbi:MAG TPA: LPS export ABC transporter periplasmic protein LptC [candidate division Zixibacteria bacterium]|jgi:LPS export ABC transporter protein LptC